MSKPGHRVKWFFTLHVTSNNVSIFATDEYSPDQGYDTEQEAIAEAQAFLRKEMKRHTHEMLNASTNLDQLAKEYQRLLLKEERT